MKLREIVEYYKGEKHKRKSLKRDNKRRPHLCFANPQIGRGLVRILIVLDIHLHLYQEGEVFI